MTFKVLEGDAARQSKMSIHIGVLEQSIIILGCEDSSLEVFINGFKGMVIRVRSILIHICESNINISDFMLKPNFIHFPQKGT
jgi:hypothetical protein